MGNLARAKNEPKTIKAASGDDDTESGKEKITTNNIQENGGNVNGKKQNI